MVNYKEKTRNIRTKSNQIKSNRGWTKSKRVYYVIYGIKMETKHTIQIEL